MPEGQVTAAPKVPVDHPRANDVARFRAEERDFETQGLAVRQRWSQLNTEWEEHYVKLKAATHALETATAQVKSSKDTLDKMVKDIEELEQKAKSIEAEDPAEAADLREHVVPLREGERYYREQLEINEQNVGAAAAAKAEIEDVIAKHDVIQEEARRDADRLRDLAEQRETAAEAIETSIQAEVLHVKAKEALADNDQVRAERFERAAKTLDARAKALEVEAGHRAESVAAWDESRQLESQAKATQQQFDETLKQKDEIDRQWQEAQATGRTEQAAELRRESEALDEKAASLEREARTLSERSVAKNKESNQLDKQIETDHAEVLKAQPDQQVIQEATSLSTEGETMPDTKEAPIPADTREAAASRQAEAQGILMKAKADEVREQAAQLNEQLKSATADTERATLRAQIKEAESKADRFEDAAEQLEHRSRVLDAAEMSNDQAKNQTERANGLSAEAAETDGRFRETAEKQGEAYREFQQQEGRVEAIQGHKGVVEREIKELERGISRAKTNAEENQLQRELKWRQEQITKLDDELKGATQRSTELKQQSDTLHKEAQALQQEARSLSQSAGTSEQIAERFVADANRYLKQAEDLKVDPEILDEAGVPRFDTPPVTEPEAAPTQPETEGEPTSSGDPSIDTAVAQTASADGESDSDELAPDPDSLDQAAAVASADPAALDGLGPSGTGGNVAADAPEVQIPTLVSEDAPLDPGADQPEIEVTTPELQPEVVEPEVIEPEFVAELPDAGAEVPFEPEATVEPEPEPTFAEAEPEPDPESTNVDVDA